jgi:serine/threonine protein kinase
MPTTGGDSALIRQAYAGALRRDPEERREFLQQYCVGRPDLVELVEGLIETHQSGMLTAGDAGTASADASPSPSVVERQIGNYIVRRELGRGGMGVVYLADDSRLSRRVAQKAVGPGVAQTPALRDRLRDEANRRISHLNRFSTRLPITAATSSRSESCSTSWHRAATRSPGDTSL